jgi:hypothetical protein
MTEEKKGKLRLSPYKIWNKLIRLFGVSKIRKLQILHIKRNLLIRGTSRKRIDNSEDLLQNVQRADLLLKKRKN